MKPQAVAVALVVAAAMEDSSLAFAKEDIAADKPEQNGYEDDLGIVAAAGSVWRSNAAGFPPQRNDGCCWQRVGFRQRPPVAAAGGW